MRKILTSLFITMLVLSPARLLAQHGHGMSEEIRAEKIAFITQQVGITPEEAKVFWPVYEAYEKARKELHQEKRETGRKIRHELDNMTDAEVSEISKKINSFHKKEWELFDQYQQEFLQILPERKVIKLFHAEHEFKRYLVKKLRGQGKQGPGYK